MKKFSATIAAAIYLLLPVFFSQCNNTNDNNVKGAKTDEPAPVTVSLVSDLRGKLADSVSTGFETIIKNSNNDPLAIRSLAHYAYFNRELETAAWLYALANEKKPDDPDTQSNLGLALHELSVKDPANGKLLDEAIALLEKAATGSHVAANNNLGYAYYRKWVNTKDSAYLDKAEAALNKAISIDPDNSIFYSHLADVMIARNKKAEALTFLNKAFRLNPMDGVLLASAANFPEYAADKSSRSYCDSINFNCLQNCPPSIIGRIKVINCGIAEQDARLACADGKPFATSYNCDDEIPATGFMIPGLQSGFGIITPWGKLVFMMQGNGKIDFKAEVNTPVPGIRFTTSGSYQPSSGMSFTQVGGQASVNLYNEGLVAPLLNQFNMGPAGIKINAGAGTDASNLQFEAYDTPIVNFH